MPKAFQSESGAAARAPARTRRRRIALLMNGAGLGESYQGDLRCGVELACREHDVDLWVYAGRVRWTNDGQALLQAFELVDPARIDGIVLAAGCISTYVSITKVAAAVARRCPVPACAVGARVDSLYSLLPDNRAGASSVVDHLVEAHGRRSFAVVAGPAGHEESEDRLLGTRRALARHGLELRPAATAHGNFGPQEGQRVVERMIDAGVRFDAVVTANDDTAMGVLEALASRGVSVPDEVAVVGFDDAPHAASGYLPLTTVRQPVSGLGEAAVRHLVRCWQGEPPGERVERLGTELVVRRSCGCPSRPIEGASAPPSKQRCRAVAEAAGLSLAPSAWRGQSLDLRNSWLLRSFQLCWDRLSAVLSLPELAEALACQLPRLGIENAWVALFADASAQTLTPLVSLQGGVEQRLPGTPYPAPLVLSPDVREAERRSSLTVLPLTFESEPLGVAVLELSLGMGLYALLREQIGGAIKTVQTHQQTLAREREHARLQREKLATAERLKSLGQLAAGVAHDLNNVLGPIVALPEAIRGDLRRAAPDAELPDVFGDLEVIQRAGERAARTIKNLLILGGINDDASADVLELGELLEQSREALAALGAERPDVALSVRPAARPLRIRACRARIGRALENLVANALGAIDGAGRIGIRARRERLAEPLDAVSLLEPGPYAVIEVEDTGSGIVDEHLPSIFEPFFSRARGSEPAGPGLGLAIVQRIVVDAGGGISVRSRLGQGSTFTLYFPELAEAEAAASARPAASGRRSARILVVDDEIVQLRTARRLLGQMGYEVETARSGDEAVALFQNGAETGFDLAIVDMLMPGQLNGIDTIAELRRMHPAQKALIVSGYAPERMDAEARARGLPWLPKPYAPDVLDRAVQEVLDAE